MSASPSLLASLCLLLGRAQSAVPQSVLQVALVPLVLALHSSHGPWQSGAIFLLGEWETWSPQMDSVFYGAKQWPPTNSPVSGCGYQDRS